MPSIVFADGIRDIKPPVYFKTSFLLLFILIGALLLLSIIFLGSRLYRIAKERRARTEEPPKPPHIIAYEALEALKKKNLPALGKTKEYYYELSVIVRNYIEGRFRIKAPEMTTEEFLFSLKASHELSDTHKKLLKDFLNLCDIVKFAKYGPTESEMGESFGAGRKFVDETRTLDDETDKVLVK
ncbi:MAG: hypothetical protein ABID09_01305 [Candidatus Omnitrophota bacterium]